MADVTSLASRKTIQAKRKTSQAKTQDKTRRKPRPGKITQDKQRQEQDKCKNKTGKTR